MTGDFSFEIRKELRRLVEYTPWNGDFEHFNHLNALFFHMDTITTEAFVITREHKQLNREEVFHVYLDMITYSSMGNMDWAIRSLHLSDQFLARCRTFMILQNNPSYADVHCVRKLSVQLLFEVWKVYFIATKFSLDCGVLVPEEVSSLLERSMDALNVQQHLLLTPSARMDWCKNTLVALKTLGESINKNMLETKIEQAQKK